MPFQACSIIACNYLAHARVLHRSLRKFHPDVRFTVLAIDGAGRRFDEPFETIGLEQIGLPAGEQARMSMLYGVTELATAVKPWFFRHLFCRERTELLYFDPDIQFFSPIDRIARLAREHCLVLTPHTTRPMSRGNVKPNETDILGAGAYNLGFLGLNPDCGPFLDWWSERLLREALIDFANMRFTDQRWMDFAPGYFDAFILKDETCNVAYWNADSRPISWTGDRCEVNGEPLCFFHFSGFKPENPHLLSVHQGATPRTRFSEHPALARLCREYTNELKAAEYARYRNVPYGLDSAPDGLRITTPMRLVYRAAIRSYEERGTPEPPTPFADPAAFIDWLNEPLHPSICPEITRYFWAIYNTRPDLRERFPNLFGIDNRPYYDWLKQSGRNEIPIPPVLFPAQAKTPVEKSENPTNERIPGIIITGYLRAELGTGQSGRLMAAAVDVSGEKYCTRVWTVTDSRQLHPWKVGTTADWQRYDTNLICINADELTRFGYAVGPEFFQNRYNIGFWFWETDLFPPALHSSFNFVNEIWVTSEHTRAAIARFSPVPVHTIPHPLNVELRVQPLSRADLNLPEGFLFLFMFDFFSNVERKNPIGIIKAFQRAFAPGEGPKLLIKSINGHRHLAELERLHYACQGRSDIIIRDGYLAAAERDALVGACDCYVSLHRAEGFGMTIAEAMLMEKPAIATRYSGNLEFMNDANSFLCGYKLRRVGPGCDPYPADARWADPNIEEAARLMRFVYENPEQAQARAKQGHLDVIRGHAPEVVAGFIKERLTELRKKPPAGVPYIMLTPERAAVAHVRAAIEQGVNVRRTVPSLLTWIFQGPRRAMKKFLRTYEQSRRQIALSAVEAFKAVDAEWLRERAALSERISDQEDQLKALRKELQKVQRQMLAKENAAESGDPRLETQPTATTQKRSSGNGAP